MKARKNKLQRKNRVPKVIVAMSGGVDSSVSAALLKRAGFDLVGVFMRMWQNNKQAENRAKRVAKLLGIPFYALNLEQEFKKQIVDYFLNEYKAGRTPNPCVVCNKQIKFKAILKKALELDADFVATGHYAQKKANKLIKAKDTLKDQTYFLWQLGQKELSKILFPIGDYTKTEVRQMAKEFNLPSAETKESQEVCFVQDTTNDFLKKYLKEKPGVILDKKGNKIGKHNGLWFYTIGQRKNIGLSGGPYYVVDKNIKKNELIVSKNKGDLLKKEILVKDINWISGKPPKLPFRASVQIRYNAKSAMASIKKISAKRCKIIFDKPQSSPTSGQSAVFYFHPRLLGGGIIE